MRTRPLWLLLLLPLGAQAQPAAAPASAAPTAPAGVASAASGPASIPASAATGAPAAPTPAGSAPSYAPSLKCGDARCTVSRAELKALVADPTPLLRELRLVPTDGRPKVEGNPRAAGMGPTNPGFRVFGLRENTIFHRLGVRNKDVLVSLNGYWLNDPVSTMLAINALPNSVDVRLRVERFGAPEPLTFVLVPTDP